MTTAPCRHVLQPDPGSDLQRDLHRGAGVGAPLQVPGRGARVAQAGQAGPRDGGCDPHQARHQCSGEHRGNLDCYQGTRAGSQLILSQKSKLSFTDQWFDRKRAELKKQRQKVLRLKMEGIDVTDYKMGITGRSYKVQFNV